MENDEIRNISEPHAPSIPDRLKTIQAPHQSGIRAYVMIDATLSKAEYLLAPVDGHVDYVIADRLNCHYGDWLYIKEAKKPMLFLTKRVTRLSMNAGFDT